MSLEEGREFWSFRSIEKPDIPPVRAKKWIKTPIDAFVLADSRLRGNDGKKQRLGGACPAPGTIA
jgi:hypothetical protein